MAEILTVTGLRELEEALKRLPEAVAKKVLRKSVRAGAKLVVDEARANVPVDTGLTRRAIAARGGRSRYANSVINVGVLSSGAKARRYIKIKGVKVDVPYYWKYLEFGTKNAPAQPFLRPAFEAQKTAAVEAIKQALAENLEIEAARLGQI